MPQKENSPSSISNRKNATVLFADVVGYTRMMETNEADALSKLNIFKEKLEETIAASNHIGSLSSSKIISKT